MVIDLQFLGGTNLYTFNGANLIGQGQPIESVGTETPALAPTTLCSHGNKFTREELARVATLAGTATHTPILHIAVVEKLFEALCFRRIGVVREDHAVATAGTVVSPRPISGKEDLRTSGTESGAARIKTARRSLRDPTRKQADRHV